MANTQAFQEQIGRIEELVQNIDSTADPALRAAAKELVQSVMDLHSAAFERILEIVAQAGEPGTGIVRSLGADALVGSLLVLYDLHPEDIVTRLHRGLERAEQILARRAADLQVLAIGDGVVRLNIANRHHCSSTKAELQAIVRAALFEAAPDLTDVIIEPEHNETASGFVPLDTLQTSNGSARALNRS
jgi:hypothetical protein